MSELVQICKPKTKNSKCYGMVLLFIIFIIIMILNVIRENAKPTT